MSSNNLLSFFVGLPAPLSRLKNVVSFIRSLSSSSGDVRSSINSFTRWAGKRFSTSPVTRMVYTTGSLRINIVSPGLTSWEGLTSMLLIMILTFFQASAARLLVLYILTAQSHLSILTLSEVDILPVQNVPDKNKQ